MIHTDFERGFIRAEVAPMAVVLAEGGWDQARKAGRVRVEGKDYTVADGDVALGLEAACKDASRATLRDSTLRQIHYAALMAYAKKPEYGPATITADRLEIDSPQQAIAQVGSRIRLDGLPVEPSPVDADELYRAGFMKK